MTVSIIEPPVMNGGIVIEQLAAAVQHANTVGAQHLVAGERRVVDVQRVEVDRLVRHRLAGVEQRQRTDGLRPRHQLGHRGDRTRDVGMMAERNHFHALVELQRVQVDATVIGHPYQRKVAPVRRASSCHGIRLAWCSSSVVTMTSPGPTACSNRLSPNT